MNRKKRKAGGPSEPFCVMISDTFPLFTLADARDLLRSRPSDGHKGTFGTALLICGSRQVGGCAVLAARACLRSGVGKVVVHVPESLRMVVMTAVPEAVVSIDSSELGDAFTAIPEGHFDAVGIGPGIGLSSATEAALSDELLTRKDTPHVIDADALTLLARNTDWASHLPVQSVLTPHLGELGRLASAKLQEDMRLSTAITIAREAQCCIVAKGHPTYTITSQTKVFTNTTGTDALATAGSGDVLTGIITSLLAQGYPADEAAPLGVFLHGLAGDFAAHSFGNHSVTASDIINFLPQAFLRLTQK